LIERIAELVFIDFGDDIKRRHGHVQAAVGPAIVPKTASEIAFSASAPRLA